MNTNEISNNIELLNFIKTLNYDMEYTNIFFSKNLIHTIDLEDALGNKIFPLKDKPQGYLVFVDPLIMANWSHTCHYYLFIDKDNIITNKDGKWPPDDFKNLIEYKGE